MALALMLGRRGMGRVWPNPAVGCVIVNGGLIVGRGRTADGGGPHAETEALAMAGKAARGATAYVTLEPCAHHGKTPPCAEALIAAGVARVVVATGDPNPQVSGKGISMLRDAGIAVTEGVLADQARADHAGFLLSQTEKRPFVTLKLATTLDGRIATKTGDSQWITGPDARRMVHGMRAKHDAVMVGAGTVRLDDPTLNVRGFGDVRQPVRVVISRDLDLPQTGNIPCTTDAQPVWLIHGADADAKPFEKLGMTSLPCSLNGGKVDMRAALSLLAGQGITRVFCEGGGQLAASLLQAGCVDELVLFQGPKVIGADGLPSLAKLGVSKLADAPQFTCRSQRQIGDDVMQVWSRR